MKIISQNKYIVDEFRKLFPFDKIFMGKILYYMDCDFEPTKIENGNWKTWIITIRSIKVGIEELKFLKDNFKLLPFSTYEHPKFISNTNYKKIYE